MAMQTGRGDTNAAPFSRQRATNTCAARGGHPVSGSFVRNVIHTYTIPTCRGESREYASATLWPHNTVHSQEDDRCMHIFSTIAALHVPRRPLRLAQPVAPPCAHAAGLCPVGRSVCSRERLPRRAVCAPSGGLSAPVSVCPVGRSGPVGRSVCSHERRPRRAVVPRRAVGVLL